VQGYLIVFIVGIPKLYWFGSEGDYNIMAMDFLGSNLEELFKEVGGKLSMLTTLQVADQVVSFIFHNIGIVPQDRVYAHAQLHSQRHQAGEFHGWLPTVEVGHGLHHRLWSLQEVQGA
jgi:hypothetical protein